MVSEAGETRVGVAGDSGWSWFRGPDLITAARGAMAGSKELDN